MADDLVANAAQAANIDQSQADTVAQAANSDTQAVPETISLEEAKKLRSEAAGLRRRLKELEDAKRAAEDAKLSEAERLQNRLAELEREQAMYQQERQERTVRYEVMLAASRLGIVDPEAAYRLLDVADLEFEDDGRPKNVEQALRALIKAKPYLARPVAPETNVTNPARGEAKPVETPEQKRARLLGRTGNPFDEDFLKSKGGGAFFKE